LVFTPISFNIAFLLKSPTFLNFFLDMVRNLRLLLSLFISLFILLPSCRQSDLQKDIKGELILLDSINVPIPNQKVDSVVANYRNILSEEMNEVLAQSPFAMQKATPEGLLNNFVADLVFNIASELYDPTADSPIDFCLLNYGGLRTSLPKGDITRARVFELMPFENEMVVLTLSGLKTAELFDYLARSERGMPVSGIKLGIKNGQVGSVLIQGKAFDPERNYKVVTSDYLAEGGDRMTFFLDPIEANMVGMRIRDAITFHMQRETKNGNSLFAQIDGRIFYMD